MNTTILQDTGKHSSQKYFFYRYDGLDHATQCPDYINVDGQNIGCRFPHLEASDYKDFYICVNGSSDSHAIRPSYFIFQLQNIGELSNFKMFLAWSIYNHMAEKRWRQRYRETYGNAKPEKGGPIEPMKNLL